MCAQPLDELFAGHAGPWTEQEWAGPPVVLVVEVTTPSKAWVDRLVKPDATKDFVVSARTAEGRLRLDKPFPTDLDLAALAVATRYPGP
ncbi:MAG TPA: hypothetical protein VJS67_05475 [Pseudonocardiaceae bacterium]|nr:hypothetical protein [Pseudonocardiaceae bacterium]